MISSQNGRSALSWICPIQNCTPHFNKLGLCCITMFNSYISERIAMISMCLSIATTECNWIWFPGQLYTIIHTTYCMSKSAGYSHSIYRLICWHILTTIGFVFFDYVPILILSIDFECKKDIQPKYNAERLTRVSSPNWHLIIMCIEQYYTFLLFTIHNQNQCKLAHLCSKLDIYYTYIGKMT